MVTEKGITIEFPYDLLDCEDDSGIHQGNHCPMKRDRRKAHHIMSRRVVWICPDHTVDTGTRIMKRYDIGGVPVVKEGRLVGIVTSRDLCFHDPNQLIQDVMSKNVVSILPETTIRQVYGSMRHHNVGRLPVVDESDYVVGIITKGDLLSEFHSLATEDKDTDTFSKDLVVTGVDSEVIPEWLFQIRKWRRSYEKACRFSKDMMTAAMAGEAINMDEGFHIIRHMVDTPGAIDALYPQTLFTRDSFDTSLSHPVNVAILALKIGVGLNYQEQQLLELGTAAFLHDIGMVRVPKETIKKDGKLTEVELKVLREHPHYGYKILLRSGREYAWLAEIILQEHEREGGRGYPKGLRGNDIHEYAKIIGAVDVYEALTHPRPYRGQFLPYEAVKAIVGPWKRLFSSKIINTLLKQLAIFPPHSYVMLNSRIIGRVIKNTGEHLLRPTIQVMYNPHGKRILTNKIIKLHEEPLLHITDSLHVTDLPH